MKRVLFAAFLLALGSLASAGPINIVPYASLTGTYIVTFDDLPAAGTPGTNYDTTTSSQGVMFGERFAGQALSYSGLFDVLDANATAALTVIAGAPNQNVSLLTFLGTNTLVGLGNTGFSNFDAIGEGSLAFSFSSDQSQFGFQLAGGDTGNAYVSFFRRNGTLIETLTLANLADDYYGFSREGGLRDIAGVSIYNFDAAGIVLDNLKHDVASNVPDAGATLLLFGMGLAGLTTFRRWRG